MFSFGQRQLRARLASIFSADPDNFDLFIDELKLPYGAATRFMDGAVDALIPAQRAGAIRFSESFGYDMATNRLVRPGSPRPRRPEPEPETDDGSVAYIDLWGSRGRERDTLRWHERRGPKNAPTTTIGKTREPAEPREARRPYVGPVRS